MSKFRFWATVILAVILGIIGYILGGAFPLPDPYSPTQTKIIFALFGVLIGLLTYAKLAAWAVKTSTDLIRKLVTTIAVEVSDQVSRATAKAWALTGVSDKPQVMSLEERKEVEGAIILDTSSIIDGRVLDVAKTGFLDGAILLPEFILTELQQVADSTDPIKRARGRRGFEIIDRLKKLKRLKIKVWDGKLSASSRAVDDRLIDLAKSLKAKILTADFNLNRVATIHGVTVLNFNDLTNALKTLPVPGDKINVKIVHLGKDKDQGIGYLSDGTMVVVKDASTLLGKQLEIEITKVLQGPSGRMVFGRLIHNS